MSNNKVTRIILAILSAIAGAVFIFSAYAKTMPVDDFTDTIFSRINVSWGIAAFASRFFIGLEAALGLLLLLSIPGRRKWVLWSGLILLLAFSGYLVGLWVMQGNNVDCGCMGNVMPMSPMWSLVKNAVLIIIVCVLLAFKPQSKTKSVTERIIVLIAFLLVVTPFVIYPPRLPLEMLYAKDQPQQPVKNLRKGKHIVCLLSLTCSHCRHAARMIHEINTKDSSIPFYFIFSDRKTDLESLLKDFFQETKTENIPHHVAGEKAFIRLAGKAVPAIYFMNGDEIDRKVDFPDLNDDYINKWLRD